jgi:hypothetical protein
LQKLEAGRERYNQLANQSGKLQKKEEKKLWRNNFDTWTKEAGGGGSK